MLFNFNSWSITYCDMWYSLVRPVIKKHRKPTSRFHYLSILEAEIGVSAQLLPLRASRKECVSRLSPLLNYKVTLWLYVFTSSLWVCLHLCPNLPFYKGNNSQTGLGPILKILG